MGGGTPVFFADFAATMDGGGSFRILLRLWGVVSGVCCDYGRMVRFSLGAAGA